MRTCSLLIALAVLGCVVGVVSHRSAVRHPPQPQKWDRQITITGARRTEPTKKGFEVKVAVKGAPQEDEAPQQEEQPKAVAAVKDIEEKAPSEKKVEAPAEENGRAPAKVVDISDGKV